MAGFCRGFCRTWVRNERTGLLTPLASGPNQIQHGAGYIAALLFGKGLGQYRINCFYFEYANVVTPGSLVSAPSFDASEGIEYYQNLSGIKDYLRVQTHGEPRIEIADGYEDSFEEGVSGNKLVFSAISAGTTGMRGSAFSDSVNSVIYGMALVAAPDWNDASKDIVFGRKYWTSVAEQFPKEPSQQMHATWQQEFAFEA